MSDIATPDAAAPAWPRIVAGIGLVWNAYGIYKFLGVFELARMGAIPFWVLAGFAISVFGGLVGSLCLMLLSRWATPLLVIALLADLAWAAKWLSDGATGAELIVISCSLLVSLLLAASAWTAGRRGWLR